MITIRNISIFVGITGFAMALAGHIWPGALVMSASLICLLVLQINEHQELNVADEDDDGDDILLDFQEEERRAEKEWQRFIRRERRQPSPRQTFYGEVDIYCPREDTDYANPGRESRIGWS